MTLAPTVTLANGVEMPALGFGTWPLDDREAETWVAAAIEHGYRLIDTAENYRNETGVGRGIRASGIDRAELFITTKFNVEWHGEKEVEQAFTNSAGRLGLDYIDLLLIHWPVPWRGRYVDAWRGMVRLLDAGKLRAIGVSNFKPHHIDSLIEATGVVPHVNQVQLNPHVPRQAEREYDAAHGVVTEAWAPLAKGKDLLREAAVLEAAANHGRTPAQAVLRWSVQLGNVPIPKTVHAERLAENINVFDFELSAVEMAAISALDRGGEGAVDSDTSGH
jgi:2,5-diketo-D-gluconate reductase A